MLSSVFGEVVNRDFLCGVPLSLVYIQKRYGRTAAYDGIRYFILGAALSATSK